MILDIKEVIDYCHCPMLYKFKYENVDLKTPTISVLEKYDHDIHKTAYALFTLSQVHGKVPLSGLKSVWGGLWIGTKTPTEILYADPSSWRDRHNEKRKRGIDVVINIYNRFSDNPGFPIAVNKPYSLQISKDLTLTGTWEVIREVDRNGKQYIELIDFKIDDKLHNKIHVDKDLEVTAASYAFFKTFQSREDRILYYGLEKDKVHITSRTEDDFKVLIHTVKCVASAIRNRLFYACPDDKCYSCSYRPICLKELKIENMT